MEEDTFKIAERALDIVRDVLGLLSSEQIAESNDIRSRLERMRREKTR